MGSEIEGVLAMKQLTRALIVMAVIWFKTHLAWTWYVITGTLICSTVGYLVSLITSKPDTASKENRATVQ